MGCELRIKQRAPIQQLPRTSDIANIRRRLAGKHRIAIQPLLLRSFDFAVPIGALDQPERYAPAGLAGEIGEPVDYRRRALLVSLDDEAEPRPILGCWRLVNRLEHVEQRFKSHGLLGIQSQPDTLLLGELRQRAKARRQLIPEPRRFGEFEARMQRRELDRYARRLEHTRRIIDGIADRLDGGAIGFEIALGIALGKRRLAQHIERIALALRFAAAATRDRIPDIAAHDELPAHDAHRLADGFADNWLAGPRYGLLHELPGPAASCKRITRPLNISAQVDALTNMDSLPPK